ncbi:MAG: DUF4157 domain-containing protein [Methylococcaceae bacterium]
MSQQLLTESQEKTTQQPARSKPCPASTQPFHFGLTPISQLQRTLGNRNIAQLIQAKRLTPEGKIIGLQRKLTVGAADDQYEQEADRVARQVMNTPDAAVSNSMQRDMSPEEDKDKMLQTKPLAASITPFLQREIINNEEIEDKEKPIQTKRLSGMSRGSLQRQPEEEDKEKMLQTKPLASSINPFVQRGMVNNEELEDKEKTIQTKSERSMSGSFEAGDNIETQVNQSKGRGSPLPDPVRAFMEPRFGVDFSHVRVYTGNDAIQMNRDVGAQAFTHGSDIYFGAGSSPNNLELTAHELTHVVQQASVATDLMQNTSSVYRQQQEQAGQEKSTLFSSYRHGANQRTNHFSKTPIVSNLCEGHLVSRKAEVDLPGWGSPLFGHDDSDVTFTPSGDFRTKDFQLDIAELAEADPLAQIYREQKALLAGQWAHSEMTERGGYGGMLRIKAGSKGTVEIVVKAHFFFDEKVNNTYDQEFACSWDVEADLKGKLKISRPRPQITPIGDDEAPFQLAALNPDQDPDSGSVQISPQFNSYQFTDVPNVTIGGNIDLGEEGKGRRGGFSGGVTLGNEQTFPPGVLVRTFNLELQVIDIPPPPPPKGKVTIGPISALRTYPVLFPPPKNRKGQDTLSSGQQDNLIRWFQGLNDTTKEQIKTGATHISLEGHASTTGDPAMNLELSDRRKENVKKILSKFVGNRAVFDFRSLGEYEAKTPDEVESQEERTVVVSVWEQIFEGEK